MFLVASACMLAPWACSRSRSASPQDPIAGPVPVPVPVPVDAAGQTADSAASVAPPAAPTDWCLDGLTALDVDLCYALPAPDADHPRTLLVYLHGIIPPLAESPQKTKVETIVVNASARAGVAVLFPRGRQGIGPPQARDWWAWPTTKDALDALVPGIVGRWVLAKKKLEAIAGAPFDRTFVAGSSSGAYFVSELAIRGDLPTDAFPVDGFGAMSGGGAGSRAAQRLARLEPRPFYLGFGTYDDETKTNARSLAGALREARWPVLVAEHPFGHGANETYLDEAFAFWSAPR
jgi:predicted esterase